MNFYLLVHVLNRRKLKEFLLKLSKQFEKAKFLVRSNSKKDTHISFGKKYLSSQPSPIYSEDYFFEAGNLYEQTQNRKLQKIGDKVLFLHYNL